MIAMLSGLVDQVAVDSVIVDVRGVGYLVFASSRTLGNLPAKGEPVRFLIETHVREDHIHLYGFADEGERSWFRLLTTVQGVGARLALAIQGVLAPEPLTAAILSQDKTALARADGVGPKLAARICNELRDKVGGIALGPGAIPGAASSPVAAGATGIAADALSALVNLGYPRADAYTAVSKAVRKLGADAKLDAVIRAGLQELGR